MEVATELVEVVTEMKEYGDEDRGMWQSNWRRRLIVVLLVVVLVDCHDRFEPHFNNSIF